MTTRREFLQWAFSATILSSLGAGSALATRIFRQRDHRIFGEVQIPIQDYPELQTPFGSVLLTIEGLPTTDRCAGQSKVVITRLDNNEFAALSARCTHAGCCVSPYDVQQGFINCSCHGSRFSAEGQVLQGPASQPLKRYATSFDGNVLTITIPGLVSVPESAFPEEFTVLNLFPNPSRGTATLQFATPSATEIHITLLSLEGKTLHRVMTTTVAPGIHQLPLQFPTLPSGMYILRITNSQHQTQDVALTLQR